MQYDIIIINDNLLKTYIDLLLTDKMELILMFIIWLPVSETGNK